MSYALPLLLVLAPLLGACASSTAADEDPAGGRRAAESGQVQRIELQYMTAGDLAAVLENRFRRELWVRVENRRNAVLVSGTESAVATAMEIAAALDVAPPVTAD